MDCPAFVLTFASACLACLRAAGPEWPALAGLCREGNGEKAETISRPHRAGADNAREQGWTARRPRGKTGLDMLLLAASFALFAATPHAAPAPDSAAMAPRPQRSRGISVRIPPPAKRTPLPPVEGPRNLGRPLIVIDPGHGGHDPGARNARHGTAEKDLTLALALAVRDQLLKGGRLRVALTRSDDRFLALEERFGIARDLDAALFISIHADASDEAKAHGATIYTLSSVASDQEAARLATRENGANIVNGVDLTDKAGPVSSILIDLAQRETMTASNRLAELLHREAAPLMTFREPWRRSAALVVLRAPDTPSVLFEAGYVSNDDDVAWLSGMEGRGAVAQAIAKAVAIFAATQASAER